MAQGKPVTPLGNEPWTTCDHEWLAVTAPTGDRGYQCRICRLTRVSPPPDKPQPDA